MGINEVENPLIPMDELNETEKAYHEKAYKEAYPEHAKLGAQLKEREVAQNFLDFILDEEGLTLTRYKRNSSIFNAYELEITTDKEKGDLIGRFLGIDPIKLEEEKRDILEKLEKLRQMDEGTG